MWRRRLGLGVLALWLIVGVARLSRVVEPAEQPPGPEATPVVLDFFRATIPAGAGYLFVLPGEFGTDTGLGPRLRYELYPRLYDDIRASQDANSVRELMQREDLRYVVVPDASQYPSGHWLRVGAPWLRRIELDGNRYVLEVVS